MVRSTSSQPPWVKNKNQSYNQLRSRLDLFWLLNFVLLSFEFLEIAEIGKFHIKNLEKSSFFTRKLCVPI
ncbi:hypothetical protein M8J75_016426 [Diaphorina citri]|nr:hypothetical protein M8J75_016426 [Diaphorina citri]